MSNTGSSRTLQLAREMEVSTKLTRPQPPAQLRLPSRNDTIAPMPLSPTAQYWASRALSAETLLAARERHQKEQQELLNNTKEKRSVEIAQLNEQHEKKHAILEKLVMLLFAFLAILLFAVIYLVTQQMRQNHVRQRPFHFTIPILSPFASVIENETSVMNSRTISLVLVLIAGISYLLLRHRISRIRP